MTRRWSDVGRGLGAGLGLLLLVVGVPAALVTWIGWPLPTEVPRLDEITDALRDAYVPDEVVIKALALVCWLVWVELMVSLTVEAVAYARGRRAGRVPLTASGVQRAAARLVATVALLGALAATRGGPEMASRALSPPPAPGLVAAGELAEQPAPREVEVGESEAPAPAPERHPVYVVQPRDTLWRIAECHLGDPFRWSEIYELNRGATQPDGQALRDADLIHAGWQLRLPTDATGLGTAPPLTSRPAPARPAGSPHGADDATDATGLGTPPSAASSPSSRPVPASPAAPPAPARPAGGSPPGASDATGAGAGAGQEQSDAMVLLDEDDLAPSGGATPRPADQPSGSDGGPRRPTGPAHPADQQPHAGTSSPGREPEGMVLLPEEAIPDDETPPGDGWIVAGGE